MGLTSDIAIKQGETSHVVFVYTLIAHILYVATQLQYMV